MMETEGQARRRFLRQVLGGCLGLAAWQVAGLANAALPRQNTRLIVPGRYRGDWALAAFDPATLALLTVVHLPARAHGVLRDPHHPRQLLVFARRPGTDIWRVDLGRAAVTATYTTAADRHLFGHGCWSADGRLLYVSENNIDDGSGCISVRDAGTLEVMREFPSGGIGPHELLLGPDKRTLIVANGGLLTLPETGRVKLNRDRMQPSLTLVGLDDGQVLQQYGLDNRQLSIRHLARWSGGVAVAMQYEGSPGDDAPLLALLPDGGSLTPVEAPPGGWPMLSAYAASVVADEHRVVISCPKAGLCASWTTSGRFIETRPLPGVAGLVLSQGHLWASSENGTLLDSRRTDPSQPSSWRDWQWDNHAYLL